MIYRAFDVETYAFGVAYQTPKLVCMSWCDDMAGPAYIEDRDMTYQLLRRWLRDPDVTLLAHNAAYEAGVIRANWPDLTAALYAALDQGRLLCTQTYARLVGIAVLGNQAPRGRALALDKLVKQEWGVVMDKDTYRTTYGDLAATPTWAWPLGARDYSADDAVWCLRLFNLLREDDRRLSAGELQGADGELLPIPQKLRHLDRICMSTLARETRASVALRNISNYGLRTDPAALADAMAQVAAEQVGCRAALIRDGLMVVEVPKTRTKRKTKTPAKVKPAKRSQQALQNLIAEWERTTGRTAARLESGAYATDKHALAEIDHPALDAHRRYIVLEKRMGTLRALLPGATAPIHTRFDSLLVTGRTSSAEPNLQNLPRKGGLRETVIPRAGCVFVVGDYEQIELRHFAQFCLRRYAGGRDPKWRSLMAEMFAKHMDPHTFVAANMRGVTYAEGAALKAAKSDPLFNDFRDRAKGFNFGGLAGQSEPTFRAAAAKADPPVHYDLTRIYLQPVDDGMQVGPGDFPSATWPAAAFDCEVPPEHLYTGRDGVPRVQFKHYPQMWVKRGCFMFYYAGWRRAITEVVAYFAEMKLMAQRPILDLGLSSAQGPDGKWRVAEVRLVHRRNFSQCCNYFFQAPTADGTKAACYEIDRAIATRSDRRLDGSRIINTVHDEIVLETTPDRAKAAGAALTEYMNRAMDHFIPDVKSAVEVQYMSKYSKEPKLYNALVDLP